MKVSVKEDVSHPDIEQNVEVHAQGLTGKNLQVDATITPRTGTDPVTVRLTTHIPDLHLPPIPSKRSLPTDEEDGNESLTEPDTDDEVDRWKRYSKHLYKRVRYLEKDREDRPEEVRHVMYHHRTDTVVVLEGKSVQTSMEITGGWREVWSDL